MGKRSLSPHPHPALPLKGRENSERSLKGGKTVSVFVQKSAKAWGFSPFKGGGRRGMKTRGRFFRSKVSPPSRGRQEGDGVMGVVEISI
jgi:hypothetical protein